MLFSLTKILVFIFSSLICLINSKHLPHGTTTLLELADTNFTIFDSPALYISAMAECSAQNPIPHLALIEIPV